MKMKHELITSTSLYMANYHNVVIQYYIVITGTLLYNVGKR